jgi:hypothetical protein
VKLFDFTCLFCRRKEERAVKQHDEIVRCQCGEIMLKLPPATKSFYKFADQRK